MIQTYAGMSHHTCFLIRCPQLGALLPGLSHLSLVNTLVSEVDPAFLDPELAEKQRRLLALLKKATVANEVVLAGELPDEDDGGGDSDAAPEGGAAGGGGVAHAGAGKKHRRQPRREGQAAVQYASVGTPPRTSVAGWTALLRLPRGFYSLNLLGCDLSYDSYALLRLHVGELQASKVKSPEEEAVAEKRRSAAALKREEKRSAREESVAEHSDDEAAA